MSSQRGLIAARAYELWRLRGSPEGSPDVDWYQAEKEVLGRGAENVLASGSDRGPTDSATKKASPEGPTSKPASRRSGGRRGGANGQAGIEGS